MTRRTGRRRRALLAALATLAPALVLAPVLTVAPALTTSSAAPAARAESPLLWGVHQGRRAGETKQAALTRVERLAGRRMAAVRQFYMWNEAFPTSFENGLRQRNQTLVMSVKAKRLDGSPVLWRSIANARPGSARHSEIVSWARRVRGYAAPVWVTFNHEPEAPVSREMGTSAEFVAAWRRWVTVFRQEGATNARFMWIMTDQSFWLPSTDRRAAGHWYPGDGYVHGIGGDAYNWHRCRPGIDNTWTSLRDIIDAQRRFGLAHPSEELWLTEYASTEDPADPGRKAQWLRDARALFKTPAFSVFDGVMLFEPSYPFVDCLWRADSSTGSAAAWRAWGQDAFYRGGNSTPVG